MAWENIQENFKNSVKGICREASKTLRRVTSLELI